MNFLLRLLSCIALISLMGCASDEKIQINPQSLSLCKFSCAKRFEVCQNKCVNNCPTCSADSSYTSRSNYFKYAHEKLVQGGYITRGLNSYRDPLQCRKVTCNCVADLIACNQNCARVIEKRFRGAPYCT